MRNVTSILDTKNDNQKVYKGFLPLLSMVELKTLKDLKEERLKPFGRKDVKISANRLRAEAVKWVKKYKSQEEDSSMKETKMYWSGKKQSLMDFFNLTEENLK